MKRFRRTISLLSMLFPLIANADNDYVDLELPSGLLWATCNIGAESPEQYGNYYNWTTNPVQAYWDDVWRTPTKAERDELVQYCTYSVEVLNGVKGARYTGSNGKSIFFPFAGYYQAGNGPYKVGEGGQYWTITAYSETAHWILATNNATQNDDNAYYWPLSYFSFPVRPVTSEIPTEESSDILINEENFPDENFRSWLLSKSYGSDGVLTEEEIAGVSEISVRESIQNLKGIEYFTALTRLDCSFNQLTSLDMSKNTALTRLDCDFNQLTSIDVSENIALTYLSCYFNQLTSLDMSKNTALTGLSCHINQLTSLDVSKNTALTELYCYSNQLTSLDVSKNTELQVLRCDANQLTSLDVSKNTALTELYCFSNQLTSLDMSKNTALTELYCYSNQLTSLDVSKNTALTKLYCYSNQLTSLDVSKNTALTGLYCDSNQLASLDVSKNTALTGLSCYSNQLASLDVSKNTALTSLGCGYNQLTSLDVSKNTELQDLRCDANQLTSLDVSKNTALRELYCSSNQLTSLNVSKNTALTILDCHQNRIKGDGMDALITSLPIVSSRAIMFVIYNENEQNVMTSTQVAAAKAKGWMPRYYDGTNWKEYVGSAPSGIQGIMLDKKVNAPIYDLNGRRLTEPQKGINIIGGKKILKH